LIRDYFCIKSGKLEEEFAINIMTLGDYTVTKQLLTYTKILLPLAVCSCMLPVLNMHVDSIWVRGLLIFISFAAQIALTVCLIIKLKREEASNELEKAAIWYQVAARIVVLIAVTFGLGYLQMQVVQAAEVTAYTVEQSFWSANSYYIVRPFVYSIAVSFAFAVITHAKEQIASFWTNAGKLVGIGLVPIYILTFVTTLVTSLTGAMVDMVVTWLLWMLTLVMLTKINCYMQSLTGHLNKSFLA